MGAYLHLAEVKWVMTGAPGVKPLLGLKGWVPWGQMGPLYLDPTVRVLRFLPTLPLLGRGMST